MGDFGGIFGGLFGGSYVSRIRQRRAAGQKLNGVIECAFRDRSVDRKRWLLAFERSLHQPSLFPSNLEPLNE